MSSTPPLLPHADQALTPRGCSTREIRARPRRDTAPSRLRGKRILYVDDNTFLRRVTGGLLGDAGAICLLAGTHDQAVTLVDSEPELALAILDFQMPDGDVGHLVKRLRTARAVLPLIGTSAIDRRRSSRSAV